MSGFELLSIVRKRFPQIPVIAISGEFLIEPFPPGLLADAFFQKGAYRPSELIAAIRQLVTDSPLRPNLAKCTKVPLWIPKLGLGYFVATCTECLRSFPVEESSTPNEVQTANCPSCETTIEYMLDSSVLNILAERSRKRQAG